MKAQKFKFRFWVSTIISLLLILAFCIFFINKAAFSQETKAEYVPGKAIICVKGSVDNALENSKELSSDPCSYSVDKSLIKLSTNSDFQSQFLKNPEKANKSLLSNQSNECFLCDLNSNEQACEILSVYCEDTESFVKNITNSEDVLWAQPDYIYTTYANAENDYAVDDPFYKYQWGFDKGIYGLQDYNAEIEANKTWNSQKGKPQSDAVVAVLDSGVDYKHEDMADSMWSDGENYPSLTSLGGGKYGINIAEDEDSTDPWDKDSGHGTHCAGAIAGQTNNNIGITGVNSQHTKIMACRWMKNGQGATSDAVIAYKYVIEAKKAGVNVVCASNSWGSTLAAPYDFAVNNIVIEAGKLGIASCFAAGNSSYDMDVCPNLLLNNPYAIYVGASNDAGKNASFSNFGKMTVDVFAPGVIMLNCTTTSTEEKALGGTLLEQYIPWIQKDSDTYYKYSFNTASEPEGPIKVSHHKINDEEQTPVTWNGSASQVKIPLDSYNVGDNVGIHVKVKKDQILDMISSEEMPYACILFNFSNPDIVDTSTGYKIGYLDSANQWHDLFPKTIFGYNDKYNIISEILQKPDFLKEPGDYVDFCLYFTINANTEGPYIAVNEFGYGNKCGDYYFMNGTSMACPVVSGIISNVSTNLFSPGSSQSTARDVVDVLACIKASVRRQASDYLKDKCVTQGVVDMYNAYAAAMKIKGESEVTGASINPVLENIKINEDGTAIIDGYFFGNTKANLYMDGQSLNCTEWTDSQIKFILPDDIKTNKSSIREFKVINNNGNYNRNFFEIKTSINTGYTQLKTSGIVYHSSDGYDYTTDSLNPMFSTATENYLYCMFTDAAKNSVLERYNFETKEWSTLDISELNFFNAAVYKQNFQMVAGKDEVYIRYEKKSNNTAVHYLATFSEKTNSFINDVDVNNVSGNGDMLAVYKGGLMFMRADLIVDAFPFIDKFRDIDIVKVYPDTGEVYEEVGKYKDLNKSENGIKYFSCGRATVYGDKLYITDSYQSAYYAILQSLGAPEIENYNDPIIYDGKNFYSKPSSLYSDSNLIDTGQACCSSGFAVSEGALVTGMVKDNAKESMIDTRTWNLQESNDITNWKTINPNYTIDNYKTKSVTTVCHNNNYYVLAQRGLEEKLIFEYLNLAKISMKSQNIMENAKKSDNNVNPDPHNQENSDNNLLEYELINAAKTGDYLWLLVISLLIGVSIAALILYNEKQNK